MVFMRFFDTSIYGKISNFAKFQFLVKLHKGFGFAVVE